MVRVRTFFLRVGCRGFGTSEDDEIHLAALDQVAGFNGLASMHVSTHLNCHIALILLNFNGISEIPESPVKGHIFAVQASDSTHGPMHVSMHDVRVCTPRLTWAPRV